MIVGHCFNLLVVLLIIAGPVTAKEVTLERVPWPSAKPCSNCLTLQFGVLEMRLPNALVGRVFVPTHQSFPVQLLPKGAKDARTGVLLLGSTEGAYMDKYGRAGLKAAGMSASDFFDAIGQPPQPGTSNALIRKMEALDEAIRYTKASKGQLRAYRIQGRTGESQYVHVVVDGSRDVYSFVGNVTPALYDAILSNMTVKPEP